MVSEVLLFEQNKPLKKKKGNHQSFGPPRIKTVDVMAYLFFFGNQPHAYTCVEQVAHRSACIVISLCIFLVLNPNNNSFLFHSTLSLLSSHHLIPT